MATKLTPFQSVKPIIPIGLSRVEASRFVGVSTTKFDQLVKEKLMPEPKRLGRRKVWDRRGLQRAFEQIPGGGDFLSDNPWDKTL